MKSDDPDLACQRVVELVTDYLEGALPSAAGAQLEQHLLICDACSVYVDQHRSLATALSPFTGERINRFLHIAESPADLAQLAATTRTPV